MRYYSNFMENTMSAVKSNDISLLRGMVIDELALLIEEHKEDVVNALRESNVKVSNPNDIQKLIKIVSYNIANNRLFQKNISTLIIFRNSGQLDNGNSPDKEWYAEFSKYMSFIDDKEYSNQTGWEKITSLFKGSGDNTTPDANPNGDNGKGLDGETIGQVVGLLNGIFDSFGSKREREQAEQQAEDELISKILDKQNKPKTNYIPIIVVSSVLVIGGLVAFLTLRNSR